MAGGYEFTFLSGKRTVIYDKVHGDGRLGNFLERNRYRIFRGADRISNVDISDTWNGDDRTDTGFFDINLVQTVKFIEFADADFLQFVRFMVIDNNGILIDL